LALANYCLAVYLWRQANDSTVTKNCYSIVETEQLQNYGDRITTALWRENDYRTMET